MAHLLSKEQKLTLNKDDFELDNTPELLINLWNYNYYLNHKHCHVCKIYFGYCKEIFKKRWDSIWGDYDEVIEKIENTDKDFINLGNYSSMRKWAILDILIQLNKEKNCKKNVVFFL